jgi:hypothetical protein
MSAINGLFLRFTSRTDKEIFDNQPNLCLFAPDRPTN